MLIVGNGTVLTRDASNPFIQGGCVVIDKHKIVSVGRESEVCSEYPQADYLDARGGVIMPGLINCHTHLYAGLSFGLSITGNNPKTFLEQLTNVWWNLDGHMLLEHSRACAYATMLDCIRNGVTTIFDHHASFGEIPGSLFAIADVAREVGMRACLCYETSDRGGEEKRDQSVRENAEFARWATGRADPMIAAMFGGHALFTLSDETLSMMAEANDSSVGYHIHASESMDDVYDSVRGHGCRPIERLYDFGMLGEKSQIVHCVHLTPLEIDLFRETRTRVINNPQSNMGNAVGCSPVPKLISSGLRVGLGTDTYTNDMIESLKSFICIQHHDLGDINAAWGEGMGMLFGRNAEFASQTFGTKLGVLMPGAAGDVVTMDYLPCTPMGPNNIDGHVLFGMSGRSCRSVVINGTVVYRDRTFAGIDEERVSAMVRESAQSLWNSLDSVEGGGLS